MSQLFNFALWRSGIITSTWNHKVPGSNTYICSAQEKKCEKMLKFTFFPYSLTSSDDVDVTDRIVVESDPIINEFKTRLTRHHTMANTRDDTLLGTKSPNLKLKKLM